MDEALEKLQFAHHEGALDEAINMVNEALEAHRSLDPPPSLLDEALSFHRHGGIACKMGQYKKALFYYQTALEIRSTELGPAHLDVALSHNNIAVVHREQCNHEAALCHFQNSLEIRIQVLCTPRLYIVLKTPRQIVYCTTG